MSSRGARLDARLRDESIDHLAGSRLEVKAERRTERRNAVAERTIAAIKKHGTAYSTASEALRAAAVRHFGSWARACGAAGLDSTRPTQPLSRVLPPEMRDDMTDNVYVVPLDGDSTSN